MEKLSRKKYTKEFREQAVKLVSEQDLTIPEAAKRFSMSGQPLSNWILKAHHGELAGIDEHRKPVTDLQAVNKKLEPPAAAFETGKYFTGGVSLTVFPAAMHGITQ